LKLDVLIDCEQRFEPFRYHEREQFAVSLRRPAHIDHMQNLVSDQIALERPRHAFIE
jgi:hypothetical protein